MTCVFVQEMLFSAVIVELKGYFEVFFEESPPFKLLLTETDSDLTVWSAIIREGTALSALVTHSICFFRDEMTVNEVCIVYRRLRSQSGL